MTRRKREQLREDVIIAARDFLQHGLVNGRPFDPSLLQVAVDALDAYEAAELTGAGARSVRGAPETSAEAAGLAEPLQFSARSRIIRCLLRMGGATDDELERQMSNSHQTVSSARNWLVEAGWVRDSGLRRKTRGGRLAVVWELTPAGRQQWKGGTK